MWKELLGFAIFLVCSFPSRSLKDQPAGFKAFILSKPDSIGRQHFPQRAERNVGKKDHAARQNVGAITPRSISRVHYAAGLTRRSANPYMSLQIPKVGMENVISQKGKAVTGAKRIRRDKESPSSSQPSRPAQLSLSSTPPQHSPLPSPSIPLQYSALPSSTMPSESLKSLSTSTTSHHLQRLLSSMRSSELLLPSTTWEPSKLSLSTPSLHSTGKHLLPTLMQSLHLHSTPLKLQPSELLLPSTSRLHPQFSASSFPPPLSPHPTGPRTKIFRFDPTVSSSNAQRDKPGRPYWAIGVAVAGVIHILIAAYIIRAKLWNGSTRRPSLLFGEKRSSQVVILPQMGQAPLEVHI